MKCKDLAQHYASDYIDEELTFRQKLAVRSHLFLCGKCRRFVKNLRLSKTMLTKKVNDIRKVKPISDDQVNTLTNELMQEFQKTQKAKDKNDSG